MYKLASNLFLFLAGQGSGQFKEVVFVLPIGLYTERKITTAHPILTNQFKNILPEAVILILTAKYLRTFSLSPKTRCSSKKESVTDDLSRHTLTCQCLQFLKRSKHKNLKKDYITFTYLCSHSVYNCRKICNETSHIIIMT